MGTREVAPCAYYGFHQMSNTGNFSYVSRDGNYTLKNGGTFECNCGEVFVCEGVPTIGNPIGHYYYGGELYDKTTGGYINSYIYWETSIEPKYTSNSTVPGFRFVQY